MLSKGVLPGLDRNSPTGPQGSCVKPTGRMLQRLRAAIGITRQWPLRSALGIKVRHRSLVKRLVLPHLVALVLLGAFGVGQETKELNLLQLHPGEGTLVATASQMEPWALSRRVYTIAFSSLRASDSSPSQMMRAQPFCLTFSNALIVLITAGEARPTNGSSSNSTEGWDIIPLARATS